MKQTAVEWLVEQVNTSNLGLTSAGQALLVELAKQMEKEQMCECYNEGLYQDIHSDTLLPFEQYYNETFKSE